MQSFRHKLFLFSFFALILIILGLVVYMLLPFWEPIFLALISAVVFYPIFRFFKKVFISDLVATFVTLFVVFSMVIVPLTVAAFVFAQELTKLVEHINDYYRSGQFELLINDLKGKLYIYLYQFQERYPFLAELLKEEKIKELVAKLYSYISQWFTNITKEAVFWLANTVFYTFIYLITLFFALYQGGKTLKHIKAVIPLEEKDKEEIFQTLSHAIKAVIYGTAGTAVVQSLIALGLYIYYGLPYPFLWALITALAAFIPPFGTGYVWFPLTVYELVFVDTFKGLVGLAVGFLIISSIDNIVRPLVMKEKIELPYIVLFFSVMGGLFTFGFTGIFLGPTIFALFITMVDLYEKKFVKTPQGKEG